MPLEMKGNVIQKSRNKIPRWKEFGKNILRGENEPQCTLHSSLQTWLFPGAAWLNWLESVCNFWDTTSCVRLDSCLWWALAPLLTGLLLELWAAFSPWWWLLLLLLLLELLIWLFLLLLSLLLLLLWLLPYSEEDDDDELLDVLWPECYETQIG